MDLSDNNIQKNDCEKTNRSMSTVLYMITQRLRQFPDTFLTGRVNIIPKSCFSMERNILIKSHGKRIY